MVLCVLLAEPVVILMPVVLLGFIGFVPLLLNQLPWSALSIEWTTPLRIAAALAVAAAEGLLLWVLARRYTGRDIPGGGPIACLLEHMSTSRGTTADPNLAFRGVPAFMLPRQRLRPGEGVRLRVARLLGQPFAPGFVPRQLLVAGGVGALMALLLGRNLATSAEGLPVALASAVSSALPWLAVSVSMVASGRLAALFRSPAPELTELHLLPGQGDRVARGRRVAALLVWQPLQAQAWCAAVIVAVLWACGLTAAAPTVLASALAVAAISVLEAVRYLERGEGWLGRAWMGGALALAVVLACVIVLAFGMSSTPHDNRLALPGLVASGLLLAFSLWRGGRAVRRAAVSSTR